MSPSNRTDNRDLRLKLAIRRWTIAAAGLGPDLRVLDLCAGEGHIWQVLRKEYRLSSYTPCDRNPRMPGTIKGDAERLVESFDLSLFDVIDVDTWGSPWEIWLRLSGRVRQRTAILLTHGTRGVAGSGPAMSLIELDALGIPRSWPIPKKVALNRIAAGALLAKGVRALNVLRIAKAETQQGGSHMCHYGLAVEPKD